MESDYEKVVRTKSAVNYSYTTIKITQSRIDKGLIAIPISLADKFPKSNDSIEVYLNNSPTSEVKKYSTYASSTRECRIGGVKEWFKQNNIQSGDEIVIQFIDPIHNIYRIIPERVFVNTTQELEQGLDISATEQEAEEKFSALTQWTQKVKYKVAISEYLRLINNLHPSNRQYIKRISNQAKESAPPNIKTILEGIYKGHCQVCDFWFLNKERKPYFEIHHLDPSKGHHPKNLLVVCGNCHNQFEHSSMKPEYNSDSWLTGVIFNEIFYPVNQIALNLSEENFTKACFI
jgi:hypothetical protein